ncbi:MAG TPA: hypothetical protein VFT00_10720 [Nocardioides sp.]|nr:hypothetical protein [Nocardioides sp.]
MSPRWRGLVRAMSLVAALAQLALLTACAPGTPDEGSWRLDARHAVSDVSSQTAAVKLALDQERRGHVFARYLQTVAVEAEENAGASSEKFSATQPPAAETSRYSRVTDELERDTGLLADVRIAVVARRESEYAALAHQLAAASERLATLERELEHAPGAASHR